MSIFLSDMQYAFTFEITLIKNIQEKIRVVFNRLFFNNTSEFSSHGKLEALIESLVSLA